MCGLDDAPVAGVVGRAVLFLKLVFRDDEPMAPAGFDDHAAIVALHDFAGDHTLEKPVLQTSAELFVELVKRFVEFAGSVLHAAFHPRRCPCATGPYRLACGVWPRSQVLIRAVVVSSASAMRATAMPAA